MNELRFKIRFIASLINKLKNSIDIIEAIDYLQAQIDKYRIELNETAKKPKVKKPVIKKPIENKTDKELLKKNSFEYIWD